jgi:hypothetical protein
MDGRAAELANMPPVGSAVDRPRMMRQYLPYCQCLREVFQEKLNSIIFCAVSNLTRRLANSVRHLDVSFTRS